MRIKLASALLLLPALLSAQALSPVDEEVVVREEEELTPAVIVGGVTKEKHLLRPGAKLFGGHGVISLSLRDGHPEERELGAVAKTKKPFLVKDILLSIHSNHIPGCVASINIYRIEGREETFVNVLRKPLCFDVAVSDDPQDFDLRPEETLLLEPGKYFIAFRIVGYDEGALQAFLSKPEEERHFWEMTMDFNVFLKSSYYREVAMGELKHYPVNIGVSVKGLEYQVRGTESIAKEQ